MLLRASGTSIEIEADIHAVLECDDAAIAGVPAGPLLARLARAVAVGREREMAEIGQLVRGELGESGLADAVGVAALFNAFCRIADATGLQLSALIQAEAGKQLPSVDLQRLRN